MSKGVATYDSHHKHGSGTDQCKQGGSTSTRPCRDKKHLTPTIITMGNEKPLLISASSLPGNLFTDEALVVACSLGRMNEIKITSLLDTEATGIAFIDLEMAHHVCDVL